MGIHDSQHKLGTTINSNKKESMQSDQPLIKTRFKKVGKITKDVSALAFNSVSFPHKKMGKIWIAKNLPMIYLYKDRSNSILQETLKLFNYYKFSTARQKRRLL